MKIHAVFLNPPFKKNFSRPQRSPAVTRSGTLYFPIWLCSAASFCESKGFNTPVVDGVAKNWDFSDIIRMIRTWTPEVIFMDVSTPSLLNDMEIAGKIKGYVPNIKIFAVGTHASGVPEELISQYPFIDGVCVGEYEWTSLEILENLKEKREIGLVEGLFTRENPSAKRSPYEKIEEYGFVSKIYKKYLSIGDYYNPNSLYPMITLVTGRDCPNYCSFCVYPQTLHYRGYRPRPIDDLINELDFIENNFPEVKGIFFEDDTFTADLERVNLICEKLKQKKYPFHFSANCRADVPVSTLTLMNQAGFRQICVGFESGSQKLLERIGKGIQVSQLEEFAKNAHQSNLKVHGCFMFGIPGETRESMKETLEMALRMPLNTAQFYPLMPYPGTKIFQELKKEKLLVTENYERWLTPEGNHNTIITIPGMNSVELVEFCNFCRFSFYLRIPYIIQRVVESLKNPDDAIRIFKGFISLVSSLIKDKIYKI